MKKQPFEMTREEYLNKTDGFPELPARTKMLVSGGLVSFDKVVAEFHEKFIKDALAEGKTIPAEVLREAKP